MSLRVMPNTSRFRRDLQAQLERATSGIEIALDVMAQTAGLRQEVQAAAREAGAGVSVEIPVTTNRSMLDRLTSVFDRIFTSAGTVETPTLPLDDLRTFSVGLDGVAQQVETTTRGLSRWAPALNPMRNAMSEIRGLVDRLRTSLASVTASVQRSSDAAGVTADRFKALNGALGAAAQDRTWSDRLRDLTDRLREAGPAVRDVWGGLRALPGLFSSLGRSSQESADGVRSTAAELRGLRDLGTFRLEADGNPVKVMSEGLRRTLDDLEALGKAHRRLGGDSERSGAQIRRENSLLSRSFSALGDLGSSAMAGLGSVAVRVSDSIGGAFANLGQKILGVFATDGTDALGKSVQGIAGGLGQALVVGLKLFAVFTLIAGAATLIAALGAAISAVYGLVATALAVVPGLLVGIGLAAGVIYLGFDGIKRAASGVEPVIDRLRDRVSGVFERGFRPLFESIGRGLTALEPDIVGVADKFVSLGDTLSKSLGNDANLNLVRAALKNIGDTVAGIGPGISGLVEGFLLLGAQTGIFTMLGDAVNGFGTAFEESVRKKIGDGTLGAAVEALSGTFDSLTGALVGLVENGISLFATAGPSLNGFIDSLTNFFGRFDFEKLGAAVGSVFDGLAAALDKVPDSTIRAIEDAFVDLGNAFNSPAFQNGLSSFINALPQIITIGARLIEAFGLIMDWVGRLVTVLVNSADTIGQSAVDTLSGLGILPRGITDIFGAATTAAGTGSQNTTTAATPTGTASTAWGDEARRIADNLRAGVDPATIAGGAVSAGAITGLNSRTGEAAGIGTALINGMANALRNGASRLASIAGGIAREVISAFKRAADINSPSGETEYVGRMLIAGLANSMRSGISDIRKVSAMVGAAAVMGIPAAASIDVGITEPASIAATQYVSGDVAHQVKSDGFGYESMKEDMLDVMSDWTFRQDPNATWKMVKNQDTRRDRRR